jgi:nitroimidazol reductase NimA-like FMN-containing flavoprotein (pyridoxamine 5'-phosphate oxidase superfamily)
MTLMDDGLEILTEDECQELLASGRMGRVAISIGALPAVLPVSYVLVDGEILFETGEGAKLRAALDRAVIAFEVDSFTADHASGWSVLAVGVARVVTDPGVVAQTKERNLRPFGSHEGSHVVAIRPDFLSGRRFLTRRSA